MSIIPSIGANTMKGSFFANGANNAMQASNYTQALKDAGLRAPEQLIKVWDVNGALGGPVQKDKLWYYWAGRLQGNRRYVTGMYYNLNAGNPAAWTYAPDLTRQAITDGDWKNTSLRLTWQATSATSSTCSGTSSVCASTASWAAMRRPRLKPAATQGHPTRSADHLVLAGVEPAPAGRRLRHLPQSLRRPGAAGKQSRSRARHRTGGIIRAHLPLAELVEQPHRESQLAGVAVASPARTT
jgi:hypothetical protein